MIKGEYSKTAAFLHILLIFISGMMCRQMLPLFKAGGFADAGYSYYAVVPGGLLFILFSLLSPLVNIKTITIDDSSIIFKYLLWRKRFVLSEIDGYFTMDIPSKNATYETIYPVSGNRILPPVSSFYTSNYDEVKKAVPLKKLGKVKFSWKNYLIVLLFKKYNELDK